MIELQTENLSKKYNRHFVFDDLSFVHTSGILGISGANGSGKSTLLKCLAFLTRQTKGNITWRQSGRVLTREQVKLRMGYAAPYINLYPELTVAENLSFLIKLGGFTPDPQKLEELLERVQIPHLSGQPFNDLSTGQQQRVKLASVFVRKPDIVFLDEPGSNLDKKGHGLVKHLVNEACSNDKLVIIASNDPKEIELCHNVITLGTLQSSLV